MSLHRRNPYPGLILVALIPALLLGGLWQLAFHLQPPALHVPLVGSTPPVAPAVMRTPLLSVRRAPAVLSNDSNLAKLQASLTTLTDSIDDTSCIEVALNGTKLAAKHEDMPLRPAGNVQLVIAAVALEVLGPDYGFTTSVQANVGPDGIVAGNLYLVGGGDPLLSNFWWTGPNPAYPPTSLTIIEKLADSVVAAGVRAIKGNIVGDASRYDDELYPATWTKAARFVLGGPIAGLVVNDSHPTPFSSATDPAQGAADVLRNLLRERGVLLDGLAVSGKAASTTVVASIKSNPLPKIITEMLTTDDNNTAEMLLKELAIAKGATGTRANGLAVVDATLRQWVIPMEGVKIVDGSGVSDDNRMTCAAIIAVLKRSPVTGVLGQAMPIGGQAGGTLSGVFGKGPLHGVIRAKTGALANYEDGILGNPGAKALSGYIPVEGGGLIQFSMLLNGQLITEPESYTPIWDLLGSVLGDYVAAPSSIDLAPR